MRDEWSSFADLLADLITKYAAEIDIDSLPDPDMSVSPPKKETIVDFLQIQCIGDWKRSGSMI